MRILRIEKIDLNVFEFDWDLTWAAFFMNGQGKIYGRFGGRDAKGPDTRNSLAGLNYAMRSALAEHRKDPSAKPDRSSQKPLHIEKLSSAQQYFGCIHCHQAKEILRQEAINNKTWVRESIYTYPLPENVGIAFDLDQGNLVRSVAPGSGAERAGLKPGDLVRTLNQIPVNSFADAQYALHKSPLMGKISVTWQREGLEQTGNLLLPTGWRRTNITWRPSLLDLLPSLTVYGADLSVKEKKTLGLTDKRLAFRQDPPVHAKAKEMGVQENDIIIGIDNLALEMSMEQFLGYVRQNYLIGEPLTINLLRNGKRVDLKVTLK